MVNLFATRNRLTRLLTSPEGSLTHRLYQLPSDIQNWSEFCSWVQVHYPCETLHDSGPNPRLIERDSLFDLPQIRYWSGDSSAYYSLPVVFTRTRDYARINAGVYRLVPIDSRILTINWRPGSNAYTLWRTYADKGERMPVTVALGVDPALIFAALFPLPEDGSELAFWGFIGGLGRKVILNNDGLPEGIEAEIVLEGYVDPETMHPEGHFANHTGYYTESVACPVMHVTSIRSRQAPILPIAVVGPPPTENALVGSMVWELLSIIIKRELPCLLNLVCPSETAFLPVIVMQIKSPTDASSWEELKLEILGHSILKRAHTLILVDETTDITRSNLIYWHCMNLELNDYSALPNGMRVVDGVRWRYTGKHRVSAAGPRVQD